MYPIEREIPKIEKEALETERLTIRKIVPAEYAFYLKDDAGWNIDPLSGEVTREDLKVLEERQTFCKALIERREAITFSVLDKNSGEMIGFIDLYSGALKNYEKMLEYCHFEMGYHFQRSVWGNGFATEAVNAMINLVFSKTNCVCITCGCSPMNAPSNKLLRKLGFTYMFKRMGETLLSDEQAKKPEFDSFKRLVENVYFLGPTRLGKSDN